MKINTIVHLLVSGNCLGIVLSKCSAYIFFPVSFNYLLEINAKITAFLVGRFIYTAMLCRKLKFIEILIPIYSF